MRRWNFERCLMRFFVDGTREWVIREPHECKDLNVGDEIETVFMYKTSGKMLRVQVTELEALPETEQIRVWFKKTEDKPRPYRREKKEPRNPIIFISRDDWGRFPPE